MTRLRVALFGSPAFALPTLEALREHHDLALVVSQPDKPAGRGMSLRPAPTAARARELGIELWQPTKLRRDAAFLARLAEAELDVGVTAAYGRILPSAVFETPTHGVLNVHASLLPAYRGAAPIQWALIDGVKETGVSIMQTEAGLDTGPVRLQRRVAVGSRETAPELMGRLAEVGAQALLEALELLAEGKLPSQPQDDAQATLAPLLTAEDGHVRWGDTATTIYDRFRGVAAWPGTSFEHRGKRVKVVDMEPMETEGSATAPESHGGPAAPEDRAEATTTDPSHTPYAPGTVVSSDERGVLVSTGGGLLRLLTVKPPGGRQMSAHDWANGRRVTPGERLG